MANEAVLIHETAIPIPMTVADGTGIERGAVLKLTDPLTASIASAADQLVAGIASEEKIANNGRTKLGIYRAGIFRVKLSGSCTVGDALSTDVVPNHVKAATGGTATLSGSKIIGYALETGATDETILMELKPQAGSEAKQ